MICRGALKRRDGTSFSKQEAQNSLGAEVPQKEFSAVLYTDENFFSQGGTEAQRRNYKWRGNYGN